jgi:hydroxymethylbilane synthase
VLGIQLCQLRTLMAMSETIRIGSRGSQLALWQARWVREQLLEREPQLEIEIVILKTKGDKILDTPLAKVGGKGLFVKEIEEALLEGRVDLAVHSMKDMPSEIPKGLCIGAIPPREDPRDVIVSARGWRLNQLPKGAVVGTSSLRRAAQLHHQCPDLVIVPLRGNLDTRLKKLHQGEMTAVVLAAAGMKRLGLEARITEYLSTETMLPAVGQGALCIEIRSTDARMGTLVSPLDDPEAHTIVSCERAFLHRLEGGCQVPIAGHGRLFEDSLSIEGLVADAKGEQILRSTSRGAATAPEVVGRRLAESLLAKGARQILETLQYHAT